MARATMARDDARSTLARRSLDARSTLARRSLDARSTLARRSLDRRGEHAARSLVGPRHRSRLRQGRAARAKAAQNAGSRFSARVTAPARARELAHGPTKELHMRFLAYDLSIQLVVDLRATLARI